VIRPLDPESDAAGVVELIHEAFPAGTTTVESWLQQQASIPARAGHAAWVAIADGTVVGRADASLNAWSQSRTGIAGVSVSRPFRRRGIGSALWEHAQRHLDDLAPTRVISWFMESPEGVAFAQARGFAEERADTLSCVDPSTVDPPPPSSGVVPLRDVSARQVYDVDLATTPDVPMTDMATELPFDEWLDTIWRRPTITHDGSFAAIVDDHVVAITLLAVNVERGRAFTEYTATLPLYRNRGLAERVKRASLAWAAAHGIRAAWTTNDETNAAMLAVNRRLGYETRLRRVEYLRDG
jgi:GNAT superfamily N-acetyltransferase